MSMGGSALVTRRGSTARGYLWIVDRVDDAYESSVHVVYPGDVERTLAHHPAVADASVVAHDGTAKGFVVLTTGKTLTEDELLEFCRARLAAHEVPSSVVLVDWLPRSSVGKLLRQQLAHSP
jgi:acyl-CoA synthetase (AMP-forming)/AMP-acid ligase II